MSLSAEVTTIIRTYNRCDRTLCAIESAIGQTLSDQPIIVVDDGSTDNVAEAIDKKYGSRITVIRHEENKGVGAAANTGLAVVDTPFVAFLDSDDIWEPEFLEAMLATIKAVPGSTMAYCDIRFEFPEHGFDYAVAMPETDVIDRQLLIPPFTMSSVMLRVRSARRVGQLRTDKEISEDTDFFLRMWLRAPGSFVHVEDELVRHRIWSGNITNGLNRLISETDQLIRQYIRHPYFSHLKDSYSDLTRQRLLGVAARHQVMKWLKAEPRHSLSLIVTDVHDIDTLERSLNSAAHQRLPPLDVAIAVEKGSEIKDAVEKLAAQDWPFSIRVLAVRTGIMIGECIQYSLNALVGSAVVFLKSGEEFAEGALDAHRHALFSSPKTVLMTYGGAGDRIPGSLPRGKKAMALRMITQNIPISLSTICIPRKALVISNIIPKHRKEGFFLALVLSLLNGTGPIVRISKPVICSAVSESLDREQLESVLKDLSESDYCHDLIGVFDQVLDQRAVTGSLSINSSDSQHG